MPYAIGLDLGGSSAKVALVTGRGDVLAEDVVAISSSTDPAENPLRSCRGGSRSAAPDRHAGRHACCRSWLWLLRLS